VSRGLLGRRQAPTPAKPPAPRGARVLTASGRRIDLDAARGTKYAPHVETWQQEAWAYRASIGEIRYAVGYLRKAVSRVRIFPAVAEPDGAEPTPLAEAEGVPPAVLAAAEEALSLLTAGTNDWASLLAPYAENFEVAGEAWLVGRPDPDAAGSDVQPQELWQTRSTQEIEATDRGWRLKDHPGDREGTLLSPESAHVSRLWLPHPQWRGLADSPMGALLGPCEELQLVSRMIRGASRSRLAGAGLLLVPDEIAFQAAPLGDDPDPEDVEADDFFTQLTRTMTAALEDEGDPSSVVPIVVKASAEALKEIRHLTLANAVDEKLLGRIEAALRRIGGGLDVPPEIVTGMAEVNHWTSWQIDASTIKMHVEPLLIEMLSALTAGYLRHALTAYGVADEWARKVICWYDVTPLTVRQNRTEDARIGHERNVLSDVALVQALGFDPETDMPDEDELARRITTERGTIDATLMDTLLRMFLVRNLPEAPEPPAPIAIPSQPVPTSDPGRPGGETPGPDTGLPIAAAGAPQGPVIRAYRRESQRLGDIDRQLLNRLAAAAESATNRALEKAGARLKSQVQRDPETRALVAGVEARDVGRVLGEEAIVAAIGDPLVLLAGAWDDVERQWGAWTAAAREDALRVAAKIAGHRLDDVLVQSSIETLDTLLAGSAPEAWAWLQEALNREVLRMVYAPDLDLWQVPEDLPELKASGGAVTSLVRGALAIAGGLPSTSGGLSPQGLPVDPHTRLGGIATGDFVDQHLRGAGVETMGYEWVYGISENHFIPHRNIDGIIFLDFESDALANPRSDNWPSSKFAPGDHKGCHCDAQPVYADGLASASIDAVAVATYDPSYLDVLRSMAADDVRRGFLAKYPTLTTPIAVVKEAERIANVRPSRPQDPTPITDAVKRHHQGKKP
jgi:hypothetical protein